MCEEKTDYEWRQNIIYNNGDRFLYAMVFMRFSVFGILEDDLLYLESAEQINDLILDAVIQRSFRDAAGHVLKKAGNKDVEWKEKKNKAKTIIKFFVNKLTTESEAYQKKEEKIAGIDRKRKIIAAYLWLMSKKLS